MLYFTYTYLVTNPIMLYAFSSSPFGLIFKYIKLSVIHYITLLIMLSVPHSVQYTFSQSPTRFIHADTPFCSIRLRASPFSNSPALKRRTWWTKPDISLFFCLGTNPFRGFFFNFFFYFWETILDLFLENVFL